MGAERSGIKRLNGGINNQVFLCTQGSSNWVLKGFPETRNGQTDRMKAEVEFLEFAEDIAPSFTPRLYHADWERRYIVQEFIEGDAFTPGAKPSQESVQAAADFYKKINSNHQLAKHKIKQNACDGHASLRMHIQDARKRLNKLYQTQLDKNTESVAKKVLNSLRSDFEKVKIETENLIGKGKVLDEIPTAELCISPSDFGFHNAIQRPENICFIDFEYAGWDDPAKTVVDFALQPKVPVLEMSTHLLKAAESISQADIGKRCIALKPILRVKWACIILSVLNTDRAKDVLTIVGDIGYEELISTRLQAAEAFMEKTDNLSF